MPQVELTRGEYGLEGEIRLPAWEHWQIQEQAQPIRVDFGGDRVEEGQELTEYEAGMRSGYLQCQSDHAGLFRYKQAMDAGLSKAEAKKFSREKGTKLSERKGGKNK